MLLSAAPSLIMLIFGRKQLKKRPFSLGRFGYAINVISVLYTMAVIVLVMVSERKLLSALGKPQRSRYRI